MRILYIGLGRINTKNNDGGSVRLFNVLNSLSNQKKIKATILLPTRDIPRFKPIKHLKIIELKEPPLLHNNAFFHYLYRTIVASLLLTFHSQKYDIVYAASDFFHDSLPALFYKLSHYHSKFILCLFLFAPQPRLGYEKMYSKSLNSHSRTTMSQFFFFFTQALILKISKPFINKIMVLNRQDAHQVIKFRYPKTKVEIVSMGVDINLIKSVQPFRRKYLAGYVGRIHPQKGLNLLIDSWKNVTNDIPNGKLFIIGGGTVSDINKLLQKIKNLGLDRNIDYLGFKTGKDVYRYLKSAKIQVVPSLYESWGQVVIEGFACGRPVVAFELPVFREIFKNKIAYAPIGNIQKLAFQIIKLSLNQQYYSQFSHQNLNFASQFDWATIAHKELKLYLSLVIPKTVSN